MDRIRNVVPDVSFAFESGTRFGYEPSYTTWAPDDGDDPAIFSGSVEEISRGEDFVKLLVQSKSVLADELLGGYGPRWATTATATHSATRDYGLVEVSAPASTRAPCWPESAAGSGSTPETSPRSETCRMMSTCSPGRGDRTSWRTRTRYLHELGFPTVPSNTESGVGRTISRWLS